MLLISFESPQVYEFAVKEVLIHRVPLVDGGISPQKKKRKHRHVITKIDSSAKYALIFLFHFKHCIFTRLKV